MDSSNIHILHARSQPLAHKLEALLAANRLSYSRLVFDSAYVRMQESLVQALKARQAEIVLDLNFAETATLGKFRSMSRPPWANSERPWLPSDFGPRQNADLFKLMAEFAVEVGAHAVLAPTHLFEGTGDPWHALDFQGCLRPRDELDRIGGQAIGIDYQLITTMSVLKDPVQRAAASAGIAALPIQNSWLRASGFGATATGAGTRYPIESVRYFHELGRAVVLDMAGGSAGLSTLASGAAGGLSHGVAVNENFSAADWRKPPKENRGGGHGARVYIAELDRYFSEKQAEPFFAVRGTRSRFGCADTACCQTGIDDMAENSHAHFTTQRCRQIAEIDCVPEARRAEHFLLHVLDPAVRSTRQAAKLRFSDDRVQRAVIGAKARLVRFRDALGGLNEADGAAPSVSRSRTPTFRGAPPGTGGIVAIFGGQP